MSVTDVAFWGALAVANSLNLITSIGATLPQSEEVTADYFEPVAIESVRVGDTAALFVDRIIHRPITMSFVVRVMERNGEGWSQFCRAEGPAIEYSPDSVLFDKNAPLLGSVGLSWWTYGECPVLPEGEAQIWTTWTPQAFGLYPVSIVTEVTERLSE